jgi:hypothetical protein
MPVLTCSMDPISSLDADLFLKLDATPPATALGAGMGDIEGLLKLGLEILDGESLLTMVNAPFLVPVEQLGREDFEAGCDDQLLGDESFQGIHLLPPTLRGRAHDGRLGQPFGLPLATAANWPHWQHSQTDRPGR